MTKNQFYLDLSFTVKPRFTPRLSFGKFLIPGLFICILSVISFPGYAQNINTVAGIGLAGFTGDGGPATDAKINYPWGVATDNSGNLYIGGGWWTTSYYARVRKVSPAGIITTFAGNGTGSFSGDGGPATDAELDYPAGVATDPSGNVYILDWGNYRVRKVNTSGIISTIAGNGAMGYTGDGGPATAAEIEGIYAIAADAYGNVYFGQFYNYCIRKINSSGIISTITASGTTPSYSGDGGPASAAHVGYVYGITTDAAGNVYFGDWGSNRVRVINAATGVISTYAGNGGSGFGGDGGPATAAQINALCVAMDAAGNLNISDLNNERIRKVNAAGTISTIAGTGTPGFSGDGGPATAAKFYYPYGICTDPSGNVYVSDYENIRIRKITNYNRPPNFTGGVSQNLVVCENSAPDSINSLLSVMDSDAFQLETWALLQPGSHGVVAGSYTTVSTGTVMTPHGMSYTPTAGYSGPDTFKITVNDGYAFDTMIVYVTVNPTPASIIGATSSVVGGYTTLGSSPPGGTWTSSNPSIATVGASTGIVLGLSAGTVTITYTLPTGCIATTTLNAFSYAGQIISTIAGNGTGAFAGDGSAAISASIHTPFGAAADLSGNVYIADQANNKVRKVSPAGIITTLAGSGTTGFSGDGGAASSAKLNSPYDVAVDASGNVYIADAGNNRIRMVNTSGIIYTYAGNGSTTFGGDGSPATAAGLWGPSGLAIDASGNMYVSSDGTRVRKINSSGIISTFAGTGVAGFSSDGIPASSAQLHNPVSVAVDASGNVFIADQLNERIRKVNSAGIISTIAGTGTAGYTGDGTPATAATVHDPWGIAVDALGNVFVGDHVNNVIRKINTSGVISTYAGTGTSGFGGDGCAATAGILNSHWGICVDGTGSVYIADGGNNRVRRVSANYAPFFTGGHNQTSSVCENSIDSVNGLLAIKDIDNGQAESWTVLLAPLHGSLVAAYSVTSTGSTITPVGLYYSPTIGYTGLDSFKVIIADCGVGYDTTKVVVTITPPPSSIVGTAIVCPGLTTLFTDPVGAGAWTSSNTAIATVGSSSGLVTGVASGTATITYSPGAGCSVTRDVTVSPAPAAIVGPSFVCNGLTASYTDPTSGGAWSTSSSFISIGSGSGIVTGSSLGVAQITYTQAGCPAFKTVSVNPVPGPILGVSAVCAGANTVLTDAGSGVWSTSTPAIATIDSFTGLLTGVSAGSPVITYTLPGGCIATGVFVVSPIPAPIIGPSVMCVGSVYPMADTPSVGTWSISSLSAGIISVNDTGLVTGTSSGTAVLSFTGGIGCTVTKTITVNAAPAAIVGPSPLIICIGSPASFTDATSGGLWSSSNLSAATIGSSSGIATGVATGSTFISYTLSPGCYVVDTLPVGTMPAPISGTSSICSGLTTTLTDATPGGFWSSSIPSVGAVGSTTGIVTGGLAGTTTIAYTTAGGCAATMLVTVNSTPGSILGVNHVCLGSTITLSDLVPGGTWTSSAPLTASVGSSSGVVTGVATGPATISYSFGPACTTTLPITVNPLPALIVGTPVVCVGSTTTLSDPTGGGIWTSSAPLTASVGSTSGVVGGLATGTANIDYILTGSTSCARTLTVTVNPLPAVIGGPSAVCPGTTITLTDATLGGTWASIPTAIATIGSSGIVTGVAPGNATISYTAGTGCARTKLVTVNPLPSAISGPSAVCVGSTITLSDVGGGYWSTSGSNASVGSSTGVVTGITAGNATITYIIGTGCYITAVITVNPLPSAISGPSALCAGATITLSDPSSGTWVSSTPSVATIGSSTGVVTGVTTGSILIVYTLPTGCVTNKSVTVSNSPVPISGPSTICAGSSITLTDAVGGGVWSSSNPGAVIIGSLSGIVTGIGVGLSTTIDYSLGTGCTVTKTMTVIPSPAAITGTLGICVGSASLLADVTSGGVWSSSLSAVASVGSAGLVSGVATGNAVISYTAAGCSALAYVTVNPVPAVITGPTSVCAGSSITQLDAVAGGTWSSLSPLVSVGSSSGNVTGVTAGVANITYATGSCSVTRPVTVNPISPISGPAGLCAGTSSTLTDPGGGIWTSTTTSVATIGSLSGIVFGVVSGTSAITYTLGTGCSATITVTVSTGPSAIAGSLHVCAGGTTSLTDLVGGGTWSMFSTYASVGSSSGSVTGIAPGTATVTYSIGSGCSASAVVTVNPAPSGITGATQSCVGSSITLGDGTPTGTWTSGNPGVASVGGSGIVNGVTSGNTSISYTVAGCSAVLPVTVNPVPAAISGPSTLCSGLSVTLTDAISGGTWTSSNASVASIGSSSGTVTGALTGAATITYSIAGGCNALATINVTTGPAAITGASSVCIGLTAPLADATPGGVWSSDNAAVVSVGPTSGIITGVTTGMVNISYSIGGCVAVKPILANLIPGPITGGPNICLSTVTHLSNSTGSGVWSCSNTAIASIDTSGNATGVSLGSAIITYSLGPGCNVVAPVTVNTGPAAIAGASHLCLGGAATLTDATSGGVWSSTNPAIATISGAGFVTSISGGIDTIFYTTPVNGCRAHLTLPVIAVPAISSHDSLCAWGDTTSLSDALPGGIFTSSLVTVTNYGGGLGLITGAAPGIGTITYIVPAGCFVTKTITVNTLPASITGNYHLCTGFTSILTDAMPGGVWSSSNPSVASIVPATGIATGVATGTAFVTYALPTGCKVDTTIFVGAPPSAISGSGNICAGSTTLFSDTVLGGAWSSSNLSVASAGTYTGVISGISAGTATITYTVGASCTVTRVVTVNPLPTLFTTTGGGSYCAGGAGLNILLGSSQAGLNYQLYNGTTPVGTALTGTGSAIDFGPQPGAGTYTIVATDPLTSCSASMGGTAIISPLPLPAAFAVTGGGNYCAGAAGVHIGLASSASGVSYQLYLGTSSIGPALSGSGSSLDFGLQTVTGTYFVKGTNTATTCNDSMTGTVLVGITPAVTPAVTVAADLGDTVCSGTAVSYTATAANGGSLPLYQWKVNGTNAGTGTATYSYSPANADVVSVVMTSSATCPSPATATGSVTMTVENLMVPLVTIAATPGTVIISGQSVTFTASVSNGGPSPSYQWQVNSAPQSGATTAVYTTGSLNNGDVVTCVVTSNGPCGATGNGAVTMSVNGNVGVKGISSGSVFTVLPNPNNGEFTITGSLINLADQEVSVEITDMLGQLIYKGSITARNGIVNQGISLRGKAANGMYLLNLNTASENQVFHLVIEQ